MKRLTAILLAIALTISACDSPAGDGGSASEETDSQNGEVTEDLTEAEWTAEDRTDREEGFVPAEEAQESGEEQLVEEPRKTYPRNPWRCLSLQNPPHSRNPNPAL